MRSWILMTVLLAACRLGAWDWNLPPLWIHETFRDGREMTRILGPLGEYRSQPESSSVSIHPLFEYAVRETEAGSSVSADFLWPLFFHRSTWFAHTSFFLLYYTSSAGEKRTDFLFPFWFSRRNPDGSFKWAVIPFYGDVDRFLTYDRVKFICFPFWWNAEKGSVSGDGWLWPLINYDSGPYLDRMRFFPFYAYSERKGRSMSRSVLWPFFSMKRSLDPKSEDGGFLLWPLWGESRLGTSSAYSVLWPLFSFTRDRKHDSWLLNIPFPFFRFGKLRGENEELMIFWPICGYRKTPALQYSFGLWPFFWNIERKEKEKTTVHSWSFPFYWSKTVFSDGYSKKLSEDKDFWPFLSLRKKDGKTALRVLQPVPRGIRTLDNNYSPFWTLYTFESDGSDYRSDLFWGMFQMSNLNRTRVIAVQPFYSFREDKSGREQSIFFNLFKMKTEKGRTHCRLFYLIRWQN